MSERAGNDSGVAREFFLRVFDAHGAFCVPEANLTALRGCELPLPLRVAHALGLPREATFAAAAEHLLSVRSERGFVDE